MYEGVWKNDEQEGKFTYADGGVFEGDWKNDGREGGQEHVDVRRRVRVRGRLQERQDGGQVHVHRRGRVRGRLCIEERRAQEEGSQASRARGRRAQEEGGQVGFEVSFPSGRARATFEILRILKQTRIFFGSQAEILLNLLKRILGGVQAYAEKFC